ncbi:MAG: DUF2225 domain-containing protein [Ignavibacteriales bacterium]
MDEIFYNHSCTCPICDLSFKTKKVHEKKINVIKKDADFCKYFEGPNPYFYEINVCPNCGFSFSDSFNKKLTPANIDNFVKVFAPQWNKINYTGERDIFRAIETYKLAIVCGQILEIKPSSLAKICLKICWLYRLNQDKKQELKFIKGAIDFFEKAYEVEDFNRSDSMEPEMIVYLLGELNYRLGNAEETKKWFNIGLTKYGNSVSAKKQTIDAMRERWLEIKADVSK